MPIKLSTAVAAVGLCLIVVGVAIADGTAQSQQAVKLYRSGAVIAASDPKHATYRPNFTPEACEILKAQRWKAEADTKTSGPKVTYSCETANRSIITFHRAPVVPVNCVVSQWGALSDPPWQACANGQQSRALVRTRTIVTQPANGGAACPSLVETQTETRACSGTASLSWTPRMLNTDGSALTNLAGYRIHYGRAPAELTQTIQVPIVTRYDVTGLEPGVWYFAVRAYTSGGTESDPSNIGSKSF